MANRIVWCLSLAGMLVGAGTARSQETGDLTGAVTDTSGAVLPGVLVTVTGPVLLQPQTAVTSETGTYRFARLAIGTYAVAFRLDGFRPVVREDIKIEIGFTATVNVTLELSVLEETITVRGETPIVDSRDTGRSGRFTRDALDRVPTARDPWVVLAQAPGVLMNSVNVGGNLAGQQAGTASRGDYNWNNTWTLDGVEITDVAAIGASSIYYDFDSFQEMQVTTGGHAPADERRGGQRGHPERHRRLSGRAGCWSPTTASGPRTWTTRSAGRGLARATRSRTSRTSASKRAGRSRGAGPGSGVGMAARTPRSASSISTRRRVPARA